MSNIFTDNSIQLGPIKIAYYALCILSGAIICYLLIRREWKFKKYNLKDIDDFFLLALFVGIIGARLWYVIFNIPFYINNIPAIIEIWKGGLAIHGGLVAGTIFGYFYFKKRHYQFWDIADTIFPYILIAQAFGRWGNFFNKEAFGSSVSVLDLEKMHIPKFIIDKMFIDGSYHHPTFLYESIACILAFIIIKIIVRFAYLKIGQEALLYGLFYSVARIFIEQLRTDSLYFGFIKTAQLFSLIIIIICTILFFRFDKKHLRNTLQERRSNCE